MAHLAAKWQSIPVAQATRSFSAVLPLAAGGWYTLEVEAMKQGKVLADLKVEKFGMGEVFVGAGQSNSTNCGEIRTQQKSGMVSSFGGDEWQIADDPQLGVADKSQGGSFWPAFGDAMYERFGVPIGVATTGFGGTSVNQWQPDGDLFPWMMTRIHQLGPSGFRAMLWHQGESDVEMPSDEYYAKLSHIIQKSQQQAGWYFPWFVAQASYHNPEKSRDSTPCERLNNDCGNQASHCRGQTRTRSPAIAVTWAAREFTSARRDSMSMAACGQTLSAITSNHY